MADEEELARSKSFSTNLCHTVRTRQLLLDFNEGRPILRLGAPKDLVNFPSIFLPRWPIECEVISDRIHHIEWDPPEPEPFYQITGHESAPMPVGEEQGKLVYCTENATKPLFFTCSRVGGSKGPIKTTNLCEQGDKDMLEFESRFESGNLQKAVQVGDYDYELTLRPDLYMTKHTQWFYFRVRNMKAKMTYRFTIVNLMKSSSLYSQGTRPLLYSERAAKEKGVGWHRVGSNIKYYRNCSQNAMDDDSIITLYSLTWTLQFPYEADTCYLAHCYPYTYSHLQRYLKRISSNPVVSSYCKVRVLCRSLAGNNVYVLTITSQRGCWAESRARKAVVVTARVHPGETNSSWMMEGLLDFLLGDSDDAQLLRDTFVFKVVPMLNPDGVVVGNYRCSLAGRDLNRNYRTMFKDSFPCVWYTRYMVERLMSETDVILYCDFHGHNRKNNVFMYGCNKQGEGSLKLHERIFPLMMSKNADNKFSFKSCKFRVQKSKEGTGRIVMWRLGIRNSYTIEASFGGSTLGDRTGTHFTTRDLKSLGFCFCDTLLDYCDPDPTKTTYCLIELSALLKKKIRGRLVRDLDKNHNFSVSDLETSTSGSNSTDSDGLPAHLVYRQELVHSEQTPVKKKKRLRTRADRNKHRPQRATNIAPLKESTVPHMNPIKVKTPARTAGKDRKRWQLNNLMGKSEVPPPSTHHDAISHDAMWHGCQPVKNTWFDLKKAMCLHHGAKASPRLSSYINVSPPAEASRVERTQQLHIIPLPQTPSDFTDFTWRQHRRSRQSLKGSLPAGLTVPQRSASGLHTYKVIPAIVPTKLMLGSSEFSSQRIYAHQNPSHVSERYFMPEASVSHTDMTKSKRDQDSDEYSAKVGLSLRRRLTVSEQDCRDLTPDIPTREPGPGCNFFMPVQRRAVQRRQRLNKDTSEKTKDVHLLPHVRAFRPLKNQPSASAE